MGGGLLHRRAAGRKSFMMIDSSRWHLLAMNLIVKSLCLSVITPSCLLHNPHANKNGAIKITAVCYCRASTALQQN
jgi:hypothetical protein